MKNTNSILYRFVCLIIFVNFSLSLKAITFGDTTLVNSISKPSTENNIVPDNTVVYPKNLSADKKQTLDYVQKFSEKRRDYLLKTFKTGKKFFPKILTVLNKYHLPQELKVLIALESGFNGKAVSRVGALGYWQIMDEVAKEYGLHIAITNQTSSVINKKKEKDDRTNLAKSTLVAVKYLRDRCRNLNNNLLLIVASYNCGVGNVWHAMERTGKSNPDFWDIKKYLPAETKAYVMNFIALNVIFNNYNKFVKNQLVFTHDAEEETQTAEMETIIFDNTGVVTN